MSDCNVSNEISHDIATSRSNENNETPNEKSTELSDETNSAESVHAHETNHKNTSENECDQQNNLEDGWLDIIGSGDFRKRVIKVGNGSETRPQQGNVVVINYVCYMNCVPYDESSPVIEQNDFFELIVGDLDIVQGFDLVIPLMETDEKAEVLIPSRLAFGKLGRPPDIPENCDLRCEIEVVEVKNILEEELHSTEVLELGNKKRDRGNFWYGRGDYLNAIHCYQRATNILDGVHDGSDSSPDVLQSILDTKLKVHNNMAAAQLKLEAYDQALKSVDFVLRIQPKNVKAHFRKSKIYTAKGQTDEALASMKKAADLEPQTKVIQQELQRLIYKQKLEEQNQRDMYKRMFSQSTTKTKSYKKWFKPWSMMAGSCLAVAVGIAAYRQYFTA